MVTVDNTANARYGSSVEHVQFELVRSIQTINDFNTDLPDAIITITNIATKEEDYLFVFVKAIKDFDIHKRAELAEEIGKQIRILVPNFFDGDANWYPTALIERPDWTKIQDNYKQALINYGLRILQCGHNKHKLAAFAAAYLKQPGAVAAIRDESYRLGYQMQLYLTSDIIFQTYDSMEEIEKLTAINRSSKIKLIGDVQINGIQRLFAVERIAPVTNKDLFLLDKINLEMVKELIYQRAHEVFPFLEVNVLCFHEAKNNLESYVEHTRNWDIINTRLYHRSLD